MTEFTNRVIRIIKAIPAGKVCTYGGVAALAGNPRAARQVVRILKSMSRTEGLPWHRIINAKGRIVLKDPEDFYLQADLLQKDGVEVTEDGKIDLRLFLWTGV